MASGRKKIAILVLSGVLLLLVGWQGMRFWWRHGYSVGMRSGVIRKISVKGTPACKYLTGELALQGAPAGTAPEIWEFSVDNDKDSNPLVQQLHEAERNGTRVTLDYRQDRKMWWQCTPTEYYVTAIEK
ncbi:MAG TPA: hypothetical protein VFF06_33255 [Polyangia bacterium]|nr:hypothetical protein [Polyangia bacterium]